MNRYRLFAHPLALAFFLTLSNAAKPVVIDDTAYLTFARHLSERPLDPYGFELFWYDRPHPAMKIILPPVLPYWLSFGISLAGEQLFLLKLWLFPFSAMLAYAVRFLVRRFVAAADVLPAVLMPLGPGVLPFFNFMLDVPAMALQLAAVALVVRCTDERRNWPALVLAGVCLGLALQTKYSVLGLPVVLFAVAFLRGRWAAGAGVVALGLGLFAAWELFLFAIYGQSHFLYHLARKSGDTGGKFALVLPLLAHLGLTAGWIGLLGLSRHVSPRALRWVAGWIALLALVVAFVPGRWTVLNRNLPLAWYPLTLADVFFRGVGGLALGSGLGFAVVGLFRRRSWETKFLLAWLVVELGTYFAVTPFAAGRRVLSLTVVLALIALRVWTRLGRIEAGSRAAKWVLPAGLAWGIAAAAADVWDALPERELPRLAAKIAANRGWSGRGHFVGHWGFQYYAEREGMRLVVPGETELHAGDWLVLPVNPDGRNFYRPYHGEANVLPDPAVLELVTVLVWDDYLAAQTIPNLYGGRTPVTSLTHPRMAVALYRVTADWVPPVVPE